MRACSCATSSSPVGLIQDTYRACTTTMVAISAANVTKNSLGYETLRAERGAGAAAVTMVVPVESNIDGEGHVEIGADLFRRHEALGRAAFTLTGRSCLRGRLRLRILVSLGLSTLLNLSLFVAFR